MCGEDATVTVFRQQEKEACKAILWPASGAKEGISEFESSEFSFEEGPTLVSESAVPQGINCIRVLYLPCLTLWPLS